jgi:hypothetical protein
MILFFVFFFFVFLNNLIFVGHQSDIKCIDFCVFFLFVLIIIFVGHQSDIKCIDWHPFRSLIATGYRFFIL